MKMLSLATITVLSSPLFWAAAAFEPYSILQYLGSANSSVGLDCKQPLKIIENSQLL